MSSGLPDWQRGIAVNVAVQAPTLPSGMVVSPLATSHHRDGTGTNTSSFTTINSVIPSSGHRYYLSKVSAYCVNAHYFQVLLDTDIVGEALINDKGWYVDFWPWGVYLEGNGSKMLQIQAKAVATGETLHGILFYEDVGV